MTPVVAEFSPAVGEWPLGMDSKQLSEKHFKDFALFPALMELMKTLGKRVTVHISCGGWVFPCGESFGVRIGGDPITLKITTFSAREGDVEVCSFPNVRQYVEDPTDGHWLPSESLSLFVLKSLADAREKAPRLLEEAKHSLAIQMARVRTLKARASA